MIDGSFLKNGLVDPEPLIDLVTKLSANVLELPGFPVINNGILLRMHVMITKMFSLRGLFLPIPSGMSMFFKYTSYSFSRMFLYYETFSFIISFNSLSNPKTNSYLSSRLDILNK